MQLRMSAKAGRGKAQIGQMQRWSFFANFMWMSSMDESLARTINSRIGTGSQAGSRSVTQTPNSTYWTFEFSIGTFIDGFRLLGERSPGQSGGDWPLTRFQLQFTSQSFTSKLYITQSRVPTATQVKHYRTLQNFSMTLFPMFSRTYLDIYWACKALLNS